MFARALPHWFRHGIDWTRGGFAERLTLSGEADDPGFKRLLVQARQIYVFSHAALSDPDRARRAHLLAHREHLGAQLPARESRALTMALAALVARLHEAMRYARERPIRGQPLASYQMTQAAIADAVVAVEGARLMTWHAATLMDRDLPANRVAAQAKLAASFALKQAAGTAQELFGGYGLASEYRIARLTSYAHVFLVGEGAPAVQRILIAEDALGIKNADRHRVSYRHPRANRHPG